MEKKIKDDLNVKLIEEVRKYECLYNVKCPQYKQIEHKERIWAQIGRETGKSGSETKKKWKYIRDGYNRSKHMRLSQTGFHKPYKYAEYLKFLDNFTTDRYSRFITPASADAEISTDLSSDYEPSIKRSKSIFDNSIQDFGEFLSSVDESSRIESLGINENQVFDVKNEDERLPEKNNDSEERTLSSDDPQEKDFSEKIIDEVKKYDCIYDTQSSQYKNYPHKKRLWHKIGKRVGLTGDDAKLRWKSIRDSYRRYRIRTITEEGFVKQYKYADSLRFLGDFCAYKPTTKSVKHILSSTEVSTDLSSDNDLLTTQEPASSTRETGNSNNITSRLFELLVNKINEADLTPQEKNDIEYTLPLDETFPALLCQSCLYRLLDAYNLQQLADASERRLRDYFGLSTSSFPATSVLNGIELPNPDLIKTDTECSPVSMYANICDMFDRHDVTNDIVEVVGSDDVELLNDVEIDVSSLTRSEAEDASLSNVFMTTKTKTPFGTPLLTKNVENFKAQERQDFGIAFNQDKINKKETIVTKSPRIAKKILDKSLKTLDKCSECGKVFYYKGYLKIHKRVHSGEKPFKCLTCSRQFITSNKLLLHQRTHNTNSDNRDINLNGILRKSSSFWAGKRFQCEICSAFFTTSSNLNSHKFTHITEREHQCKHCLLTFKSPRDLKRHEPTHKKIKDIYCTLCEKSFTTRASLTTHVITVHRSIRKHKCTDCDKIFGKKSNLINHMRIHSGEKPFECVYCSWKFAQSSALKRHMKRHV